MQKTVEVILNLMDIMKSLFTYVQLEPMDLSS